MNRLLLATPVILLLAATGTSYGQTATAKDQLFGTLQVALVQASAAEPFGTCALSRNFEERIAACRQATLKTPYPWIKRWVEDALGDLYSQQGDAERAIEHWRLWLKAEYRPLVEAKIASRSR